MIVFMPGNETLPSKTSFQLKHSSEENILPGQNSFYSEPDPGSGGFQTQLSATFQCSSAKKETKKLWLGGSLPLS